MKPTLIEMVSQRHPRLVKDFQGVNNRYGQVPVPDFLEYLSDNATEIFNPIRSNVFTSLQCQRCKWVSISMASEVLIKLYLPDSRQSISLADVLAFNSVSSLWGTLCKVWS